MGSLTLFMWILVINRLKVFNRGQNILCCHIWIIIMHLHHCEKLVEIIFYINLVVVNLTTCVYHIVIDKSLHNLFYILKLYIIDVLGILLNLRSCISHILYVWNFSHCTAAPFMLMNGKYKQGDYNNTTLFTGVLQR